MKKIYILLFILFSSVRMIQAQNNISARILDKKTGEPVEAAVARYEGSKYALSDKEGMIYITTTEKEALVFITGIGYEATEAVLQNNRVTDIKLQAAGVNLKEIIIAAPGTIHTALNTVSKIDLKLRPAKSAQELLRYVPGLFIAQHQGGGKAEQIFLRGFDIDHGTDVAISVDGLPVNMVSHAHGQGYADLHFLIPETVKQLQYGTGPYEAQQGNFSTAGYVSFETVNKLEKNSIVAEAGQFQTLRTAAFIQLLNKEKKSAYFASEYLFSNGPFQSPQQFNRFNFFAKYNQQLNTNNQLQIIASNFNSKWNASGQIPVRAVETGLINRFGAIDDTEGGSTGRTNLSLRLKTKFRNSTLSNQLYYSHYRFDLFSNFTFFLVDSVNGDQIRQKEARHLFGYNASLQFNKSKGTVPVQSTLGWGVRSDITNNSELSRTLNKTTLLEPKALGNIHETNAFMYFNQMIETGKFIVNPGLRTDLFFFNYEDALTQSNGSTQKTIISPKLNFYYNHHKNLQLFLKTGRSFHSNDTRVILQNNSRQILPAAYGADFGATMKPVQNLVLTTAAWYLFLQQEFIYVGDEAVVEAGGRTRRLGLDVSARYQFNSHWMIDANLNLAKARDIESAKGENYIPLAPSLTSIGGISYMSKKGWNSSLRYRYMKDRPANNDNSVIADGYFVTDFAVNYTSKKFEFGLIVENLLNAKWNEAQFETTSRLRNEPAPVTELHFTPGVPFFAKARISFFF